MKNRYLPLSDAHWQPGRCPVGDETGGGGCAFCLPSLSASSGGIFSHQAVGMVSVCTIQVAQLGGVQGGGLLACMAMAQMADVLISIHEAAKQEDPHVISGLLQEDISRVNAQDGYSRTPLMWASYAGQVASTRLLLMHGAAVDMKDWCGDTALHEACFKGHRAVAGMLLEKGADPSIRDQWGWTALMAAAGTGRVEIVQDLLKHRRVNVNHVDYTGRTALWRASCNGHVNVVEALLREGRADPHMPDNDGVTALGIAQLRDRQDCAEMIMSFEESEPIFLLTKARRLTEGGQALERAGAGFKRKFPYSSCVEARLSLVHAAPTYLRKRVAHGEPLPAVEVKVGNKKRSRRELELRTAVDYIVNSMEPKIFEGLLDFFRNHSSSGGGR